MNRLQHLSHLTAVLVATYVVVPHCAFARAETTKPNIIVVVVDDVHVTQVDTGLGSKDGYPEPLPVTKTPTLRALAQSGITMTTGYSANPMCWPSRGSIITGLYPRRWGDSTKIPQGIKWAPEYLKPLGYKSACIGKWHLNWDDKSVDAFKPLGRGFDEFFGFLAGAHSYYLLNDDSSATGKKQGPIFNGHKPASVDALLRTLPPYREAYRGDPNDPNTPPWYLTQELTTQACDFIDRHHEEPFFIYLAYNARHTPGEVPAYFSKDIDGHSENSGVKVTQAAMVHVVDLGMQEVLSKLERYDIKEDTLIIFVGDNGGPANANRNDTPEQVFNGAKGSQYEGGKRVPFIVSWPNGLPPNSTKQLTYSFPVMHIDIVPTILAAAGMDIPAGLDGTNLLPYLRGEKNSDPHVSLHWNSTARKGKWKFFYDAEKGNMLFDLVADPLEQKNVVAKHPEIEKEMVSLVSKYFEDTKTAKR